MIAAVVITMTASIVDMGDSVVPREGRDYFIAIFTCLAIAVLGVVPFSAFNAMGAEWDENTFDLLVISNLRPRQILVGNEGPVAADGNPACDVVRLARKRVEKGEAFEKIASEISQVAPAQGGDIGWLHTENLANWMIEVVGGLQDGDISGVIATNWPQTEVDIYMGVGGAPHGVLAAAALTYVAAAVAALAQLLYFAWIIFGSRR